MLALVAAYEASAGKFGLPPEELNLTKEWLLGQSWRNVQETIYRSVGGVKYEALHVNHYTAPWVLMALLTCGTSTTEKRILSEIVELGRSSEDGLWNWGEEKHPIWATHDALKALTEYVLRG